MNNDALDQASLSSGSFSNFGVVSFDVTFSGVGGFQNFGTITDNLTVTGASFDISNDGFIHGSFQIGDLADTLNANKALSRVAVFGGGGADLLVGSGFDDFVNSGTGDDTLLGGGGHDGLFSYDGDDLLLGGADQDRLFGGLGNDYLSGGSGNEMLAGAGGKDSLYGNEGRDRRLELHFDRRVGE